MEFFEEIIKNTSEAELNLIVFIFAMLEYILPIVPGDLALAFGIFMAIYGGYSPIFIFLTSIAGGALGAIISLLIGLFVSQKFDSDNLSSLLKGIIAGSEEKIKKAIKLINRYGLFIIIVNRFIPVLRGPIVFAAGYCRVNLAKAFSGALISAILFNLMITVASLLIGRNFDALKSFLSTYFESLIIVVIIAFLVYKAITRIRRRRYEDKRDL